MRPYVYKLTSINEEYYYGSRWDYNGNPEDDILINYFSSSKLIHGLIEANGVNYFKSEIIETFEEPKECLEFEYQMIKQSFSDSKCLNRAMGKCTIWDEDLKNRVSKSMSKVWLSDSYRINQVVKHSGENNHNYRLPPWRNVNGDKKNWYKSIQIYEDYINEKWDFSKYGYGRDFLMRRYNISQGMARNIMRMIKEGWKPKEDSDFIEYFNAQVL